jgi:hypothetical protein
MQSVDARQTAAWLSRVDGLKKSRDVQMRLDKLRQWRLMSRRTQQGVLLLLPGQVCALCAVHEQAGITVGGGVR